MAEEAYAVAGRIFHEAGCTPALVREVTRDPRFEGFAPIADAMDREVRAVPLPWRPVISR
jgi:hypothetical protein